MTSFQLCYNLNKRVPIGTLLRITSSLVGRCSFWAPARVNICGTDAKSKQFVLSFLVYLLTELY
jgi:hypothetical protein